MADDRSKAPRPKIVAEDPQGAGQAPGQAQRTHEQQPQAASQPRPQGESAQPSPAQHGSFKQGVSAARGWVVRTFPGHENAFLGGLLGFVAAILVFAIGFWQTLFVALLVLVGVGVGQQMDGDPKLWNAVRQLFSSRDR